MNVCTQRRTKSSNFLEHDAILTHPTHTHTHTQTHTHTHAEALPVGLIGRPDGAHGHRAPGAGAQARARGGARVGNDVRCAAYQGDSRDRPVADCHAVGLPRARRASGAGSA